MRSQGAARAVWCMSLIFYFLFPPPPKPVSQQTFLLSGVYSSDSFCLVSSAKFCACHTSPSPGHHSSSCIHSTWYRHIRVAYEPVGYILDTSPLIRTSQTHHRQPRSVRISRCFRDQRARPRMLPSRFSPEPSDFFSLPYPAQARLLCSASASGPRPWRSYTFRLAFS